METYLIVKLSKTIWFMGLVLVNLKKVAEVNAAKKCIRKNGGVMKLIKIEAKGFKSFANKVILNFDGGVVGIVGPNGSGKSNINDAH